MTNTVSDACENNARALCNTAIIQVIQFQFNNETLHCTDTQVATKKF